MYKEGDIVQYIGLYTPECEKYEVCYEDEFIVSKLHTTGWKNSYLMKGCNMVFYEDQIKLKGVK